MDDSRFEPIPDGLSNVLSTKSRLTLFTKSVFGISTLGTQGFHVQSHPVSIKGQPLETLSNDLIVRFIDGEIISWMTHSCKMYTGKTKLGVRIRRPIHTNDNNRVNVYPSDSESLLIRSTGLKGVDNSPSHLKVRVLLCGLRDETLGWYCYRYRHGTAFPSWMNPPFYPLQVRSFSCVKLFFDYPLPRSSKRHTHT